jgi:hypothetical protein
MEISSGSKVRFDIIGRYIAILVLGTFILDKIILIITRPYFLNYFNGIIHKTIRPDAHKITYMALFFETYYIAVFHLLVIITTSIVFLNKKFKPYKRELLWAYLIILVVDILIVQIHHLLKLKT